MFSSCFLGVFAPVCALPTAFSSLSPITSLDDFRALLVQKLVTAIRAEELDLLVPKFLPVTIELAFALWAGHPENFRHDFSWHQENKIRNSNIEIRNPGNFFESIFTTETQRSPSSEYF
jgi:hypothetical protein